MHNDPLQDDLLKPIHAMSIPQRFRFYRRWHGPIVAGALAIDIVHVMVVAIVVGFLTGFFL